MTTTTRQPSSPVGFRPQEPKRLDDNSFYGNVMFWLFLAFGAAGVGTYFIGPLVPPALMMPLYLATLAALLVSAFVRKSSFMSGLFTIAVPLVLGVMLYPTLNMHLATGSGDVVVMAAVGTAVMFGSMALLGWRSKKSLDGLSKPLFGVLIGVIVLSLLNAFLLHMTMLSLVISCAVLVIFAIFSYIDIQAIRDRKYGDSAPPYALNVFLNIYNIFVSLLNILGFMRD